MQLFFFYTVCGNNPYFWLLVPAPYLTSWWNYRSHFFTGELSICLLFVITLNTNHHSLPLRTHWSTATIPLHLGVPPYQTSRVLRGTHIPALLLTLCGQHHLMSIIFLTSPVLLDSDSEVHAGITEGGRKISAVQAAPRWITSELPGEGVKCSLFLKGSEMILNCRWVYAQLLSASLPVPIAQATTAISSDYPRK